MHNAAGQVFILVNCIVYDNVNEGHVNTSDAGNFLVRERAFMGHTPSGCQGRHHADFAFRERCGATAWQIRMPL